MGKRMGRPKFAHKVHVIVEELTSQSDLGLRPCRSASLFSPVYRGAHYVWIKLMDTDGLLVGPRQVMPGEGRDPDQPVELLVGVIVQSEDTTSKSKPNPFGKAAIAHVPNGLWVYTKTHGRQRLDIIHVVMVLPRGAAPHQRQSFETASRNVKNVADVMPECEIWK